MEPTIVFLLLLAGGVALVLWLFYLFIKKAVKDALREFEREKKNPDLSGEN